MHPCLLLVALCAYWLPVHTPALMPAAAATHSPQPPPQPMYVERAVKEIKEAMKKDLTRITDLFRGKRPTAGARA